MELGSAGLKKDNVARHKKSDMRDGKAVNMERQTTWTINSILKFHSSWERSLIIGGGEIAMRVANQTLTLHSKFAMQFF